MSAPVESTYADVKEYYGKRVKNRSELQTSCCTTPEVPVAKHLREALSDVHDEVTSRYYGCGIVLPEFVEGATMLDLGSGSGRDCFALSKLVGKSGKIIGIDMTEEQLEIARQYENYHAEKFGYAKPNTQFVQGYMEQLTNADIQENSIDIIISNCVVNLSPDKPAVLRECYKVLKEGGELYFSDVYADRDLREIVRQHKVLWGECIGGALKWQDLHSIASSVGFSRPMLVMSHHYAIFDDKLNAVVGDAKFSSTTYRLYKLPANKKEACSAVYKGGITGFPDSFRMDCNITFKKDIPVTVDAEIATILQSSRFREKFEFHPASSSSDMKTIEVVDPNEYAIRTDNVTDLKLSCGSEGIETCGGAAAKPCCGSGTGAQASSGSTQGCCKAGTGSAQKKGCCAGKGSC